MHSQEACKKNIVIIFTTEEVWTKHHIGEVHAHFPNASIAVISHEEGFIAFVELMHQCGIRVEVVRFGHTFYDDPKEVVAQFMQ